MARADLECVVSPRAQTNDDGAPRTERRDRLADVVQTTGRIREVLDRARGDRAVADAR